MAEHIGSLADFARQIREIPDGQTIRIVAKLFCDHLAGWRASENNGYGAAIERRPQCCLIPPVHNPFRFPCLAQQLLLRRTTHILTAWRLTCKAC
jgi:hypothetical protein